MELPRFGTVVARSQGVNRVALVFWCMAMARTNGPKGVSRRQLFQQRLRLLQIARVEPFREPAVHRSEQFARLLHLALVTPEAREAHGGAEFPGLCLLLACNRESTLEIRFRLHRVALGRNQT